MSKKLQWWILVLIMPILLAISVSVRAFGESAGSTTASGNTFAGSIDNGENFSCVILGSGNVRCWGLNSSGQLGLGNTTPIGDNESPTSNVGLGGQKAIAISAGGEHSCVILEGGNVRCWGANASGQLGLGNTTTIGDNESPTSNVDLGGQKAIAISAGQYHSCVILEGGNVRCWGLNNRGQLGLGNTTPIGDNESPTSNVDLGGQKAIAISAGGDHSCVILEGGNVRCWGANASGQLGLGNTTTIGDNESPTSNVGLGGQKAIAISAGQYHSCVILEGGNVRCWGANASGQLGLGNTTTIGDNESPTSNVDLGGQKAIAISAWYQTTCIILEGGNVRCWGANASGQLGLGNTTTIGDNESPTSNVDLGGQKAIAISAWYQTTCIILEGGNVRCWGLNSSGQLGLGNTTTIGDNESPTGNVSFYDQALVGPTTTTSTTTTTTTTTTIRPCNGCSTTTTSALPPTISFTTSTLAALKLTTQVVKITTSQSATANSIATFAKLTVLSTSKVSLKVVSSYAKYCKVSGTTLKGVKTGTCKVTVTVTPKKGKATSKTVTLQVTK